MKTGTALTLGSVLAKATDAAADSVKADPENDFRNVLEHLRLALNERGFSQIPAQPIVSEMIDYNGGLRHDSDLGQLEAAQFVVQPCARLADIEERERADILPLFHECACRHAEGVDPGANARMLVRLLTDEFGLDPTRLAFVSVPIAEAMRPDMADLGFDFDEKVFIRDQDEAFAARDSSGFFFQDPSLPDHMVTMGVYYRLSEDGAAALTAYPPPPDWSEIAEIVIDGASPQVFAIGVERLALVTSGRFPSWQHRLARLRDAVANDSSGREPPPGMSRYE
ncbi:hypothetical protein QO231_11920 [Sedimentitalea todarodis]|uniref:Uncharacterized protein n=1 Tax=Sedimentitalea todarodis TaxID=1631240 RepID=A0ABU3VEG8_9RHOB|nr:hypothetical protein [Sedimentitalea todarodis]